MADASPVVNACGAIGGGLLAVCTAPQLYQMWKTKSADDVSLSFTILYTAGLTMSAIYTGLIGAWAGAIPLIIECFFGLILITAKIVLTSKSEKEKKKKMDGTEVELVQEGSVHCCEHCKRNQRWENSQ
ncbi:hypothetical protein BCR33DRAFT_703505 [Rhizoclosmatium globosum]|uniref:Uncharacterized protein n=1 Tax=Rhizoclosmatium globosum TaxID=329046 RepID=A0A1Y2B652_9FUNG|nr:hypothetical protein BCR33DRAFT_703505 [Rhizoclosmatium globosum]|eukprot:ORY30321.1 hypothetical protein BCR33DRAFT_703505 [Rhizoclosmatium globosum]